MKWIDALERKFGHHAIPGLVRIIIGFNALVFILYKINPTFLSALDLNPALVMRGEVWRLVSYIFIPQIGSFLPDYLSAVLYLFFLWFVGDGLEEAFGAFKLNLFYLLGMIGTTVAAFFFGGDYAGFLLNSSLFYAFARFYPDVVIYVMYILPMKVKWLAWISAAFLLLGFITGTWSYRMAVIVALGNYLVFFCPEIWHEAGHRAEVAQRRKRFEKTAIPADEAMHSCEVCQRTEITHPDLDFRVSADGNEYCMEHLPRKS